MASDHHFCDRGSILDGDVNGALTVGHDADGVGICGPVIPLGREAVGSVTFEEVELFAPAILGGHDPVRDYGFLGIEPAIGDFGLVMDNVGVGGAFDQEQRQECFSAGGPRRRTRQQDGKNERQAYCFPF